MMQALWLAVPGALMALGVMALVTAALPNRPALGGALARLGSRPEAAAPSAPWDVRLGRWVHARLPDLALFATPTQELRLVGGSVDRHYRDKSLLALTGLLAPLLLGLVLAAFGVLPLGLPVALGLPLAVGGWVLPDRALRRRAALARTDFARAVAVYLELVAAERKRGAPAARALSTSAEVGDTWVFARIRQELTQARLSGTAPWTALSALADDIGVPELADVAKIVRLSGEEGASVAESLRGRGRTLRTQLLADEHAAANQASERMSVPLTFLAFIFVGIVLTPLVMNLLT